MTCWWRARWRTPISGEVPTRPGRSRGSQLPTSRTRSRSPAVARRATAGDRRSPRPPIRTRARLLVGDVQPERLHRTGTATAPSRHHRPSSGARIVRPSEQRCSCCWNGLARPAWPITSTLPDFAPTSSHPTRDNRLLIRHEAEPVRLLISAGARTSAPRSTGSPFRKRETSSVKRHWAPAARSISTICV